MEFLRIGGGSGTTGALSINTNHNFADTTARDTYFTTYPSEKTEGIFIAVGAGFQQLVSGVWIDKTAVVKGPSGVPGTPGVDGTNGVNGINGTNGADGTDGLNGVGVPTGGSTGQMLVKNSTADYDTKWANVPIGGSGGTSITDATIDGSGNLVLTLSDGSTINVGPVVGTDGLPGTNGTDGTDGTNGTNGVNGIDGLAGVSIQSAVVDGAGHLILTLTDASTIDAGLVKGADGLAGTTDHSLLTNLDYASSGHTGFQKSISIWATGVNYLAGDYVKNNGALYYCLTAHTSTALLADIANWEALGGSGGSGSITRLAKPSVTAPKTVDLAGNMGLIQPRIFVAGADTITVEYEFVNTDSANFNVEETSASLNDNYIWDGTMRPKTAYTPTVTVVPASGGACEYSKFTIDFNSFKAIESVVE